ncbi:MAG: ATP-binding protein [Bacteroidota bacterium]
MINFRDWTKRSRIGDKQEVVNFNLTPITNEMAELYHPIARQKGVKIINYITDPLMVRANKNQVRMIVRSLIGEVLQHTQSRDKIYIGYEQSPSKSIWIKITATGANMMSSMLELSSQAGLLVSSENAQKGQLALIRDYVEKNGGSIAINNPLGAGTAFRFSLPVAY